MEMFNFDEEFQFVLEMVILNRRENGATLSEIRDDLYDYFDIRCEAIWGYRCWEQDIKPLLTNVMWNISTKTLDNGCVLYYMDVEAAIHKFSTDLSENMALICKELKINVEKLKSWEASLSSSQLRSTNTSQTDSLRNIEPKSRSTIISSRTEELDICGHVMIGDDFFLEMARKELNQQLTKNKQIKQIGHCMSGQSIRRALHYVPRNISKIGQNGTIISLGSVDLLQGRELVDMAQDMYQLCTILVEKDIFPIVTTLPPLANQLHNKDLEMKRKQFNRMLMDRFDCIDIERCFLSHCGSVLFEQYQNKPKAVSGTRHALVLWSGAGRQQVFKMLKRRIPNFHGDNM